MTAKKRSVRRSTRADSAGSRAKAVTAAVRTANARDLQRETTRAAILQSALVIFSERGFDGGSTRDIAAHAKVHHALIKYHFKNKETLWRASVTFLFERQAIELNFESPPGKLNTRKNRREFAHGVLRRYVWYCARHPEHARLMMQESVSDNDRLDWAADKFISRAARSAGSFVRLLQREGVFPDVSVPALVYIMVGSAQLFYTLGPEVRRVWGIDPRNEAVIRDHVEAVLAVLVR